MKYDFTTLLDRHGKDSIAADLIPWEGNPYELPDSIRMNLALPKALLVEAMQRLRKYAFL